MDILPIIVCVSHTYDTDSNTEYSNKEKQVEATPNRNLPTPNLQAAYEESDWRAVEDTSRRLTGDHDQDNDLSSNPSHPASLISKEGSDEMDAMIDEGNWAGIIKSANTMHRR